MDQHPELLWSYSSPGCSSARQTLSSLAFSSLIFLSGALGVFAGNVTLSIPVLLVVSRDSSTLPVSSVLPYGALTPEPGAFLLVAAVFINLLTVCSTTGSPRVSLGSGIVTLPVVVGGRLT